MTIIITISGMILAGLLYLLFVPVYFQIGYNIEKRAVETGFIKMYPFTYRIGRNPKRSKTLFRHGVQKGKKEKNKIAAMIHFFRLLQNELETWRHVGLNAVRFIRRIIVSSDCRFNISLFGGFTEPHLTGYLYGSLCAIQPALHKSIDICYQPNFEGESFGGEVRGRLTVHIYSILRETLVFLWGLPKMKLLKTYFKQKKEV
jgi:hypothetical protein